MPFTSPTRAVALTVLTAVVLAPALTACDTDDGREMQPPTEPLPATTAPETTAPLTEPAAAEPSAVSAPATAPFTIVASWPDAGPIPVRHTCDGDDVSPALTWANVPTDAVDLAIVAVDPDADGFVHWLATGISSSETGLAEGQLPAGVTEWPNDFGTPAYGGPCPPDGEEHLYVFTLYALNQQLEIADDAPDEEVISTLNMISIDQTSVTGYYARQP